MLHASDPAALFLQVRARTPLPSPVAVEAELYESRTAMRLLAMRRTLFLASVADVPLVHAAGSLSVGAVERRRTVKLFAEAGVAGGDPSAVAAHLADLEAIGLAAVRVRGEATTAELTALDPRLGEKVPMAVGKSYAGAISVSQKVFFHLALDGRIARGRSRGTWIAGQYRWSPIERWLPDGIPALDVDAARAGLVRRWLTTFGPGTRDDVQWWTGWTVAATKAALTAINAQEVTLDGGATGYVNAGDAVPGPAADPWIALLPALDATTMGWKERDWYLGPHRPRLFDTNGNAGPTIWLDGRIVGGWGQRLTGEIATLLMEDVGTEAERWIAEEAARLQTWIGPARVSGSFRTPTEIALRS